MDNVVIDNIITNTHDLVVKINNINLRRAESGFVNNDCDYTRTMLTTICLHALQNNLIYTEDRLKNIVELIDRIGYGS